MHENNTTVRVPKLLQKKKMEHNFICYKFWDYSFLDSISMRLLLKYMYSKINMTVSLLLINWLIVVQDISNCGID